MLSDTMKQIILFLAAGLISQMGFSQKMIGKDFKAQFDKYGVDGCFVLFNQEGNEFVRYNSSLCDSGYIPASTFKIPNSLIALEEGVINDTSEIIKWDGQEWPSKPWNQDQTLKTAMKYSCVWVYTGFAGKIGIEKYYNYVRAFDYGNKNLTGPPERFWLSGLFRISANQQIDFLRKFYNYKLDVSRQSIDIVKDIIVLEKTDTWKLSGKTGGGVLTDSEYVMWLVGYLERDNKAYYFAMNFKSMDFDKTANARFMITKDILRELKLID
jgi:beta-lactamase class D